MGAKANTLTNDILKAVPKHFPGVQVWKSQRYKGEITRGTSKVWVNVGIDGQADISGIIPPNGRRLEIETKAGRDQMRPAQYAFEALIRDAGGLYLVARSVDGLLSDLAGALCG